MTNPEEEAGRLAREMHELQKKIRQREEDARRKAQRKAKKDRRERGKK